MRPLRPAVTLDAVTAKGASDGQGVQGQDRARRAGLDSGLGAVPAAGCAGGGTERPLHRVGRRRLLVDGAVGRPDRDAEHQQAGRRRPHVHELAHDGTLLADALIPADGAQPHHQRDGLHRRGHDRLPERQRPHPVRVRHPRRGAGRARMEHVHARQVASRRLRRDEHGFDEAQLAGRARVRALLRLPRRRDQPVVSRPDLRQPPGRSAGHARGRIPPDHGPHRQGDRVRQGREVDRARQAVLHVLLPGRLPRASSRAEGVDREVQGEVRHGLRGLSRARLRTSEEARDLPRERRTDPAQPLRGGEERRRQAVAAARRGQAVGLALRRREEAVLSHGGGLRGLSLAHRPRDRAIARLSAGGGSPREHDRGVRFRQRRLGRRRPERVGQREQVLQWDPGHDRAEPRVPRRARLDRDLQPLSGRLGLGVQHAFQDVEALQLRGRCGRPAARLLAEGHRREGRAPAPVPACNRHRADDLRPPRRRAARDRQGVRADSAGGRELPLDLRERRRRRRRRNRRSSRCSVPAPCGRKGGRP